MGIQCPVPRRPGPGEVARTKLVRGRPEIDHRLELARRRQPELLTCARPVEGLQDADVGDPGGVGLGDHVAEEGVVARLPDEARVGVEPDQVGAPKPERDLVDRVLGQIAGEAVRVEDDERLRGRVEPVDQVAAGLVLGGGSRAGERVRLVRGEEAVDLRVADRCRDRARERRVAGLPAAGGVVVVADPDHSL